MILYVHSRAKSYCRSSCVSNIVFCISSTTAKSSGTYIRLSKDGALLDVLAHISIAPEKQLHT